MLKKSVSLFLIYSFLVTPAKAGVQARIRTWIPASAGMTEKFDGAPSKPSAWKTLFVYGPAGTVTGAAAGFTLSSVIAWNMAKPCRNQLWFAGTTAGLIGGTLGGVLQAVPMVSHEDLRAAPIPIAAGALIPAGIALITLLKRNDRMLNPLFAGFIGGVAAWAAATLVAHWQNG